MVNPREQVIRLWEHWGKPEIYWYRGGHAGFIRSRPVQVFIQDALQQSGLLDGYPRSLSARRPNCHTPRRYRLAITRWATATNGLPSLLHQVAGREKADTCAYTAVVSGS